MISIIRITNVFKTNTTLKQNSAKKRSIFLKLNKLLFSLEISGSSLLEQERMALSTAFYRDNIHGLTTYLRRKFLVKKKKNLIYVILYSLLCAFIFLIFKIFLYYLILKIQRKNNAKNVKNHC